MLVHREDLLSRVLLVFQILPNEVNVLFCKVLASQSLRYSRTLELSTKFFTLYCLLFVWSQMLSI